MSEKVIDEMTGPDGTKYRLQARSYGGRHGGRVHFVIRQLPGAPQFDDGCSQHRSTRRAAFSDMKRLATKITP